MVAWEGQGEPVACLEKLAAEIGSGDYAVKLVTAARHPHLHITNCQARQLTEDTYCDGRYFWWSWAERITPVTDVTAAAAAISRVLQAFSDRTS